MVSETLGLRQQDVPCMSLRPEQETLRPAALLPADPSWRQHRLALLWVLGWHLCGLPAYWAEAPLGYSPGPSPTVVSCHQCPPYHQPRSLKHWLCNWGSLHWPQPGGSPDPARLFATQAVPLSVPRILERALLCALPCGVRVLHTRQQWSHRKLGQEGRLYPEELG